MWPPQVRPWHISLKAFGRRRRRRRPGGRGGAAAAILRQMDADLRDRVFEEFNSRLGQKTWTSGELCRRSRPSHFGGFLKIGKSLFGWVPKGKPRGNHPPGGGAQIPEKRCIQGGGVNLGFESVWEDSTTDNVPTFSILLSADCSRPSGVGLVVRIMCASIAHALAWHALFQKSLASA